jgi:AraC family transcriptional regulator, regulatory protein of adaptative response / methylated-DNA-[protein]-cysteine methyltransferase
MTSYERIALVIQYLDANHTEQPDLATLAEYVGLSPYHFHRLFSLWAAVTPKDFLQCLTLSHAKELLKQGNSVLKSALESGLSGPGRLHDLCVSLEAATPGELKSGGEGWTIKAGFAMSPFGKCLVGESPRGLCHLSFVEAENAEKEQVRLQRDWPGASIQRDDIVAQRWVDRVFVPHMQSPDQSALRTYVKGTSFQLRVWRALLCIPPGTLVSYGCLADAIGNPGAARAVGTAIGCNPLAFLIPCHRVIRGTGVMGAYQWGAIRKRAIVAYECSDSVL